MSWPVTYLNDTRYPGPEPYPPPAELEGLILLVEEVEACPRLFTWGELKEIVKTSQLDWLTRNKELEGKYQEFGKTIKERYGGVDEWQTCIWRKSLTLSENYLRFARLPWAEEEKKKAKEGGGDDQTPAKKKDVAKDESAPKGPPNGMGGSHDPNYQASESPKKSTKDGGSNDESGKDRALPKGTGGSNDPTYQASSSPKSSKEKDDKKDEKGSNPESDSKAYVQMEPAMKSLDRSARKDRHTTGQALRRRMSDSSIDDDDLDDKDKADMFHDYDTTDEFLKYNEDKGVESDKYAVLVNDWPYSMPAGVRHYVIWSRLPIAHPVLVDYSRKSWKHILQHGVGGFTGVIPIRDPEEVEREKGPADEDKAKGAAERLKKSKREQGRGAYQDDFATDSESDAEGEGGAVALNVKYGGDDYRRWAGDDWESAGGHEVGRLVKALWDERGWETVWNVNPARLQSIPGYAHFHIFARRKTPPEIDVSEKYFHQERAAKQKLKNKWETVLSTEESEADRESGNTETES